MMLKGCPEVALQLDLHMTVRAGRALQDRVCEVLNYAQLVEIAVFGDTKAGRGKGCYLKKKKRVELGAYDNSAFFGAIEIVSCVHIFACMNFFKCMHAYTLRL